jgi:hypothetical protein
MECLAGSPVGFHHMGSLTGNLPVAHGDPGEEASSLIV